MVRFLGIIALLLWPAIAPAQENDTPANVPPILLIDIERLTQETRAGIDAQALFQSEIEALSAENEKIFAELTKEEGQLTEERASLEPDSFREKATAFDSKVQKIRADQDEKLRLLQAKQEEARQALLRDYNVVILEIVRERGALVLLDRRQVIMSADTLDITEEAIARINAETATTSE